MKIVVVIEDSDSFEDAEDLKARIEGCLIPADFGTGDVQMWAGYRP